jgi:hypothetical protein
MKAAKSTHQGPHETMQRHVVSSVTPVADAAIPFLNTTLHALTYERSVPPITYLTMLQQDGADLTALGPQVARALDQRWSTSRGSQAREVASAMLLLQPGTHTVRLAQRTLEAMSRKGAVDLGIFTEATVTIGDERQILAGLVKFISHTPTASVQKDLNQIESIATAVAKRYADDSDLSRQLLDNTVSTYDWRTSTAGWTSGALAVWLGNGWSNARSWLDHVVEHGVVPRETHDRQLPAYVGSQHPDSERHQAARQVCTWVDARVTLGGRDDIRSHTPLMGVLMDMAVNRTAWGFPMLPERVAAAAELLGKVAS